MRLSVVRKSVHFIHFTHPEGEQTVKYIKPYLTGTEVDEVGDFYARQISPTMEKAACFLTRQLLYRFLMRLIRQVFQRNPVS